MDGLGIVVPHRAQRAAFQQAFPELCVIDAGQGLPVRSAIDTVERFQGGERTVIMVSATESDRAYLLCVQQFLLDPRRLTVALSRAKRKMILVASRAFSRCSARRGDVRQLSVVEELAGEDLHNATVGGDSPGSTCVCLGWTDSLVRVAVRFKRKGCRDEWHCLQALVP